MQNQENKRLVWGYWQAMNGASARSEPDKLSHHVHSQVVWHGFHPLRHLKGASVIWSRFWQPLLFAIPDLTRRPYHFIGGHYSDAKFGTGNWVCGTGDFVGTFANDWRLDKYVIPASGNSVHFRFGEFCKVERGKIVEIRIIIDLPDLLRQCGTHILPPQLWPRYLDPRSACRGRDLPGRTRSSRISKDVQSGHRDDLWWPQQI